MLSLITLRNRDFLLTAQKIIDSIPSDRPVNLETVAVQAALHPAPRFYCTFTYALRVMRVLRHGRLTLANDRRLPMWHEIDRRVRQYENRGYIFTDALAMVLVNCRASRFYISPRRATDLLRRYYDHSTRLFTVPA